jgi:hypothetical protein
MKNPRLVEIEIDWLALQRAFERFDPTWDGEPLPYLNLRTGKVAYFGADEGLDIADTLDFERHIALTLPDQVLTERHARMRAFLATLPDVDLSGTLRRALDEKGGVTTFYEILIDHQKHYERWQSIEAPRVRDVIDRWVQAEQLQPRNVPPWQR